MIESGYAVSRIVIFGLAFVVLIVVLIGLAIGFKTRMRRVRLARRDFYYEIRDAIERGKSDEELGDLIVLAFEDATTAGVEVELGNYIRGLLEYHGRSDSFIGILAM